MIEASADDLVSFDPKIDMGAPYIEIEPGGAYQWRAESHGGQQAFSTHVEVQSRTVRLS